MTDKSREAFELLIKKRGENLARCSFNPNLYHSIQIQLYWEYWRGGSTWRDSLLDSEAMVEKVAIAICPWYDYRKGKTPPESRWAALLPEAKQAYLDQAIAALKAMKGDK